eukprot:TRINITY_DN480_c0_g1_i1.p2 TRINITY_DN480_c0_g1~~TRINITY_DN480_c0_g1_i1.p2  ORF type:complete len:117 (+),score=25.22 TRINITY_DN480_c0_g1_i1:705-1055(+)
MTWIQTSTQASTWIPQGHPTLSAPPAPRLAAALEQSPDPRGEAGVVTRGVRPRLTMQRQQRQHQRGESSGSAALSRVHAAAVRGCCLSAFVAPLMPAEGREGGGGVSGDSLEHCFD